MRLVLNDRANGVHRSEYTALHQKVSHLLDYREKLRKEQKIMRKRNRTISIRVSEQEYESIKKKIQTTKQTQQSFILNAIEGAAILTAKDSKLLKDISMQLADLLK